MDRITNPQWPTDSRRFEEGEPGGLPATLLTTSWLNSVQEELCKVVEEAELPPSMEPQLGHALGKLIDAQWSWPHQHLLSDFVYRSSQIVGQLALFLRRDGVETLPGQLVEGGGLRWSSVGGRYYSDKVPPGTWLALGCIQGLGRTPDTRVTLFVRKY